MGGAEYLPCLTARPFWLVCGRFPRTRTRTLPARHALRADGAELYARCSLDRCLRTQYNTPVLWAPVSRGWARPQTNRADAPGSPLVRRRST